MYERARAVPRAAIRSLELAPSLPDAHGFAEVTRLDHSLVARLRGRRRFDAARERTAPRARRLS